MKVSRTNVLFLTAKSQNGHQRIQGNSLWFVHSLYSTGSLWEEWQIIEPLGLMVTQNPFIKIRLHKQK